MTESIFDELEGFFAYDQGAIDSGVKNDDRRHEVALQIDAMPVEQLRLDLSRWLREHYLGEVALQERYGWEDAMEFCKWIDDGSYRP